MTIEKGAVIVLASSVCCSALGALLGFLIGTLSPEYYVIVFRLPGDRSLNLSQLGAVLGLTQGLAAGIAIGLVIVACVTWYEVHKLRLSEPPRTDT